MAIFWCVTWIGHLFFWISQFSASSFLTSHMRSYVESSIVAPGFFLKCIIFSSLLYFLSLTLCWFASSWDADDVVWLLCQTSRSVFDCWLITKLRVRLDSSRSKSIFTLGKNEGKILTQTVSTCASLAHFLSVLLKVCTSCWSDFCWAAAMAPWDVQQISSILSSVLDLALLLRLRFSHQTAAAAQREKHKKTPFIPIHVYLVICELSERNEQRDSSSSSQLSAEHFKLNFLIFPRILLSSVVFRSLIHTERVDAGWERCSRRNGVAVVVVATRHIFFLSFVATLGVVVFFFRVPKKPTQGAEREAKRRKKKVNRKEIIFPIKHR